MSTRVDAESPKNPVTGRRSLRVSPSVGTGAGFLTLSLVVFSAAGAVWGVLRPTLSATVSEETVQISGGENVEFTSFITFVIGTALLATVVSLLAYFRAEHVRGVGMLLWVAGVVFLGALSFWAVGELVAERMHALPEPDDLNAGDELSFVPSFTPWVGALAAPLLASLSYWLASVLDVLGTPELREL